MSHRERERSGVPAPRNGARRARNKLQHEKKQEKRQAQRVELPAGEDSQREESPSESRREEERRFVPWLGEARPRPARIHNLKEKVGERIFIQFVSGRTVTGRLVSFDRSTNVVLEEAEEHLDGQKTRNLGKIFVCGRVECIGSAGVPIAE